MLPARGKPASTVAVALHPLVGMRFVGPIPCLGDARIGCTRQCRRGDCKETNLGRSAYDPPMTDCTALQLPQRIALTAFARAEDRALALAAGFDEHLAKPVEPATLVATIARVVGKTPGDGEERL